jgi:hypothetical protein
VIARIYVAAVVTGTQSTGAPFTYAVTFVVVTSVPVIFTPYVPLMPLWNPVFVPFVPVGGSEGIPLPVTDAIDRLNDALSV